MTPNPPRGEPEAPAPDGVRWALVAMWVVSLARLIAGFALHEAPRGLEIDIAWLVVFVVPIAILKDRATR